jgi:hypothetical protein
MRRPPYPCLLLLGCALLAPALLSLAREPARALAAARGPLDDARACKPQPPVEAVLQQVAAEGGVVELAYGVTPRPEAGALDFRLELPPGAELLDGTVSGSLPAGSAGTGELRVRLRLPDGAPARALLHVQGALDGAPLDGAPLDGAPLDGAAEAVALRRALTWGQPASGGRALALVDPVTGVTERLAEAPVRHVRGAR